MSPAVVTAVLLLVGVLNTVQGFDIAETCLNYEDLQDGHCEDGWTEFGSERCAQYFSEEKNFQDAQDHCSSLGANLVSIHNDDEMWGILCLTWRSDPNVEDIWMGGYRSGQSFTYTDGSEFDYSRFCVGQPDNFSGQEDCLESNHRDWGMWNDDDCSDLNRFVCAK